MWKRIGDLWGRRFARVRRDPVIVLGNQKSGTSAIAHLLADLGGLSKTIDIPALWGSNLIDLKAGSTTLAKIVARNRSSFATELIKEPSLTFFADQVFELFREARFVHVQRDPRDNIRSLLNSRGLPGHLDELEPERRAEFDKSPAGTPGGMRIRRITIDGAFWGCPEENYVGVLAHRWNQAAQVYLDHRDRLLLAKYEDFTADKIGLLRALARELQISERCDISDRLDVPFQPAGDRSVRWEEFFGAANLERIERICAGPMAELGYQRVT